MIRAIVLLLAAAAFGTAGVAVLASDSTYPTASEAAEAAFIALLPEWTVVGECNTVITPVPEDVCYRWAPNHSGETFAIHSADAFAVTDTGWWAGTVEVEGGWKPYGSGRCDLFYCRIASPDDEVLFGFPGGDVNCDGSANSQDALLILQVVAELIERSQVPCIADADVFPDGGLNSLDALSILQSDARLIGALPISR